MLLVSHDTRLIFGLAVTSAGLADSGASCGAARSRRGSGCGTQRSPGTPARGAHGAGHATPVHRVGDPHCPDHPLLTAWHLTLRPRARTAVRRVARPPRFRPDIDRRLVGRVAVRVVRGAFAAA